MNRQQRRTVRKAASKRTEELSARKQRIREEFLRRGEPDPFEEVRYRKSLGPLKYAKTGLKIAPTRTLKFRNTMFRISARAFTFASFGYVLKFARKERKFSFRKYTAP